MFVLLLRMALDNCANIKFTGTIFMGCPFYIGLWACNIVIFSQKMNKDFCKFFNSLRIKFELLENGLFCFFDCTCIKMLLNK